MDSDCRLKIQAAFGQTSPIVRLNISLPLCAWEITRMENNSFAYMFYIRELPCMELKRWGKLNEENKSKD